MTMVPGTTLLAFDFDGTLAPVSENPAQAQLDRASAALLAQTTQIEGVVVAIVSGRDDGDVSSRINMPGAYIIASDGLEIRAPGGQLVRDEPPLTFTFGRELQHEIAVSGLRVETRKHAIALHWRGIPYEAIEPVIEMFRAWAKEGRFDIVEGRSVIEARLAGGGKEDALRWLCSEIGADRVVYAGDDSTDFGPVRFAAERGRALFLASNERTPPPGVTVVGSFRELFRLIREEVMI